MSEAYGEAADAADHEDASEIEAAEDQDAADQAGDEEGDDEGEERPKRRQDPEAQLHNLKGQAAKERSMRRAAQQRSRELEERLQALETRNQRDTGGDADELLEAIAGLRDDEDDPIGDLDRVKKALKAFRSRQIAEREAETRQTTLTRQIQQLQSRMAEAETDFAQDFPDYHDAAKHYREQRQAELEDAGYTGLALQRKLADDLYGVVRMALEAGLDPAERVYSLAKRRGFAAGKGKADAKLDVLNRAAQAGRKPGNVAPTGGGMLTWDDVSKLDGAARDKAWAKLRERERGRR